MQDNSQTNWDWQALRYICDEMSVEEAAQFETVLGEHQIAREAVADAVKLRLALRQGPAPLAVELSVRSHAYWRAVLWAGAATAACLLLGVMVWRHAGRDAQPLPQVAGLPTAELDYLARAWTDVTFADPVSSLTDADAELSVAVQVSAPDDGLSGLDDEPDAAFDIPEWMIAAVRSDIETTEPENDL